MRRSKIRFRRTLAVAVALCTSAFIGVVAATPAQAAPPFDQQVFHPDEEAEWAGNLSDGDYLSDKFDGEDNAAHLTGVATNDADRYRFYVCPLATADPPPSTPGGPTALGCDFIAEDTTPLTPTFGGPFIGNADEAYDVTWDIPGPLDGLSRDIVGLACNGAEGASEPGTNCLAENEEDILLEDAPTAPGQESSGEMLEFCALDSGACNGSSIGAGGSGPEYTPYLHGITVPNDGYSMRAYVSDDHADISSMFDFGADAQTPPATSENFVLGGTLMFTGTAHEVYEQSYSDGDIDDNAEFAHSLIEEFGAGAGPKCSADFCRPDTHYAASDERVADQVHIHNDFSTVPGDDPEPSNDTAPDPDLCEDEDRTKTGEVPTGGSDELMGCIFSQFSYFADFDDDGGNEKHTDELMNEPGTFHITTDNAGFVFCEGTAHDLDGDGLDEFCAVPDPNATFGDDKHEADFQAVAGGAINIDFCHDPEAADETDPDFGCAGELTDTANKNATPGFDHVHQRFLEDYNADTTCHTGALSKNKPAASNVPLRGCVHDSFHNGAPNIPVLWRFVAGVPAQFVSVEQTTDDGTPDPAGTADAVVTAAASAEGQFTTVRFCTDFNNNGVCDVDPDDLGPGACAGICQADVQITWQRPAQPAPAGSCPEVGGYKKKAGNKQNNKLKGGPSCDKLVGKKGNDKLSGKGEDDLLKGGRGFDVCRGGPGKDIFRGCEVKRKGSQVKVG